MPTSYDPEHIRTLYQEFKRGGGAVDQHLLRVFSRRPERLFLPTLQERLLILDDACQVLGERREYLRRRWREVVSQVRRIDGAEALDELVDIHRKLNDIAVELFLRGIGVMEVHELITMYRDRLTERVLELVRRRLPAPPCAFAWFNMGSDGRREQTFFTDQDNALVYEIDGSTAVDDYFRGFAGEVVQALDQVGFALCTGNIMPINDDWRGSYARWRRMMTEIFGNQDQENLLRIIILMDVTFCAGSRPVGERFIDKVHRLVREHFDALLTMARSAVMSSVALTFFKNFRLERGGPHAGQFNVKLYGWAPLIMTARVFALKYGIRATNTVERIRALEAGHHFDTELSERLQTAYIVLTRAKMISQLEAMAAGRKYDYFLDPEILSASERTDLKDALTVVEELQKLAYNSFFGGML
ncbi:MAG: hypothetical protein JW781_03335 [Deltaproteobacteria bacterium]|nr:hypothetical protein [Candidatus Anaeroferrophillacea bacterium]